MKQNEQALKAILVDSPEWRTYLTSLETSLGALVRVLGDLSQPDAAKWSGAAAEEAANAFGVLRQHYRRVQDALVEVREAVDRANDARGRATAAYTSLPSGEVPSWIHGAVDAAQTAGEANVVIGGYAYVADQAVGIFEGWLGDKREEEAKRVLDTLEQELLPERKRLRRSATEIMASENHTLDDGEDGHDWSDGHDLSDGQDWSDERDWSVGGSVGGGGGSSPVPPVPAVPGPHLGPVPASTPWTTPSTGSTGLAPHSSTDGVAPGDSTPGAPAPGHLGQGGTTGPYRSWPGSGPDVDSGSGGTIGGAGSGFTAGALGGGAIAGTAAMRWGSRAAGAGGGGMGTSSTVPGGGVGGLLGTGGGGGSAVGAGGVGRAGGMASGASARGLAGGLAGGGTSGSSAPGSGSGAAGSGASGGARSGMVAGGAPGGAGASSGKRQQKAGLGGHIAPKLEDDDEFMPQSNAARAGGREDMDNT